MAEIQKTMGHKNGVTDYSKILPTGRENAMPREEVAARVGFASVRALQQDISQSRRAGQPICSTTQAGGGYYMAANRGELLQFVQSMERRIKNTGDRQQATGAHCRTGRCACSEAFSNKSVRTL